MSLLKTSMTHTLNSTTITLPILSMSAFLSLLLILLLLHSLALLSKLHFLCSLFLFYPPLLTSVTFSSCPPDPTSLFWLQTEYQPPHHVGTLISLTHVQYVCGCMF